MVRTRLPLGRGTSRRYCPEGQLDLIEDGLVRLRGNADTASAPRDRDGIGHVALPDDGCVATSEGNGVERGDAIDGLLDLASAASISQGLMYWLNVAMPSVQTVRSISATSLTGVGIGVANASAAQ